MPSRHSHLKLILTFRHTSETFADLLVIDKIYCSNQMLIVLHLAKKVACPKITSLPQGLSVVEEWCNSQELLDVVHYGGRVVSQLLTIHNENLK